MILYSSLVFSTIFLMSILDVQVLDLYVALFAIEYFVAYELLSPIDDLHKRRTALFAILLLLIFILIMLEHVTQILKI